MTREEAKRRAELYLALGDGKAIQVQNPVTLEWKYLDINQIDEFNEELKYRIKPEPKYRPFKGVEECWNEMQNHHPFGWIKRNGKYVNITLVSGECSYDDSFKSFTFADGTPFGIKEE